MSNHIVSLVFKRKVGRPALKQVLAYMADKASDDGAGVWCAKTTIADEIELSESSVKRCIHQLLEMRLIFEVGKRKCGNGFTVEYSINLDAVENLPPTDSQVREWAKKQERGGSQGTPSTLNPVHSEPPQGSEGTPTGSTVNPKPSITIQEPPSRADAREEVQDFEKMFEQIWDAYPKDRCRNRTICFKYYSDAVEGGHDPETILAAVKQFARATSGYTRSKVKFADNWFKEGAWLQAFENHKAEIEKQDDAWERALDIAMNWIKSKNSLCQHVTKEQISELLKRNLVSRDDLKNVGIG